MYLRYFNFLKPPFELTPNAEFVYFSEIHQDVFRTLIYGIEQQKGLMALTGPVGIGKTTICRLILNHCHNLENEKKIKIAYIFNPMLTFTEIIKALLNDFGVKYNKKEESKVSLLDYLNKFLIKEYSNKRIVAAIIDEIQLMNLETLEELRLLTNLETDNHKLIQLILCGQPEFDTIIASPRLQQLKQRVNFHCLLMPLPADDIKNYMNHRMRLAGTAEPVEFSFMALSVINYFSGGIPRVINSICDKSLLSAYAFSKNKVDLTCVISGIKAVEGKLSLINFYRRLIFYLFFRYFRIIILFIAVIVLLTVIIIRKFNYTLL